MGLDHLVDAPFANILIVTGHTLLGNCRCGQGDWRMVRDGRP
jgi:hypothetical protein